MSLALLLSDQPEGKVGKVHYGATTAPAGPTSTEPVFDVFKAVTGQWSPGTEPKAVNGVWS